jgi:alanyl-tRNA synthetase
VQVVLAENPFYPEGGGQVGDRGELTWPGGAAKVLDSQPTKRGASLQLVRVLSGEVGVGRLVSATVDQEFRRGAAAHHSATHLLNRALREVLGEGVVQRGSYVASDHATFDFGWPEAVSAERLTQVERRVNQALREDLPRAVELLSIEEARRSGAVALPDETYGEVVRVVSFGDFSKELCGGTHVTRTGEIGAVVLTGSRSVGQGLRRIELVAGAAAESWWEAQRTQMAELSAAVQSPGPEILPRIRALQERVREMEREARRTRQLGGASSIGVEQVAGTAVAIEDLGAELDRRELRQHADSLLERAPGGAALVLAGRQLLIRLSEAQVRRGLSAGTMAETVCRELGGRGGGTQELGQGRIPEASHGKALDAVRTILGSALEEG